MKTLKNHFGHTMLEAILAISIMGILAYIAAPLMGNSLSTMSLDAAARKIESDIRYAQNMAMTTGTTHGFEATASNTYRIYSVSGAGARVDVTSPHTHAAMQVDLSESFSETIFQGDSLDDYNIEFNSNGTPTSAVNVDVVIENVEDMSKTIRVYSGSGLIKLQ